MNNAKTVSAVTVSSAPHRAIKTEYRGPTDRTGSRIIATVLGSGKRFTISWDDAVGDTENHEAAAVEACRRMDWSGELLGASVSGGARIFILK